MIKIMFAVFLFMFLFIRACFPKYFLCSSAVKFLAKCHGRPLSIAIFCQPIYPRDGPMTSFRGFPYLLLMVTIDKQLIKLFCICKRYLTWNILQMK